MPVLLRNVVRSRDHTLSHSSIPLALDRLQYCNLGGGRSGDASASGFYEATKMTNYEATKMTNLDNEELEARLIYSIIVAGKSAKFAEGVMQRLGLWQDPFQIIRSWIEKGLLCEELRAARSGNYGKIAQALREIAVSSIDLRTCTPEQLEKVHGIGPKTSRFFILWTRPNERYATLDVHVLRWLRGLGYDAPKATPTGEKYRKLEQAFLKEADNRNLTPRELDSQIWETGSKYGLEQVA